MRVYCPYCKKELLLQHKIGNMKVSFLENEVSIMTCGGCGNNIGIKYNHMYKVTPQNEYQFTNSKDKDKNKKVKQQNNDDKIEGTDFEKLEKLKELLDKNIITEEEFNRKKEELLKKM